MISLICGLPGHGKTLLSITEGLKFISQGRAVYLCNFKGVKHEGFNHLEDGKKWAECPPGSVIMIDEAQDYFPQRSQGSPVPAYISAFNTHRHLGLDVWLVTQDSMNIDVHVRRLIEDYRLLVRPMGMSRATVFSAPRVLDVLDKRNVDSVTKSQFDYPRENFGLYNSTVLDTHKKKIPKRVYMFFALLLGLVGGISWFGYSLYNRGNTVKDEIAKSSSPQFSLPTIGPSGNAAKPVDKKTFIESHIPRVNNLPWSAPIYDKVAVVKTAPQVAGCVAAENFCTCYTQQYTRVSVDDNYCRSFALYRDFNPLIQDQKPQNSGRPTMETNKEKSPSLEPFVTPS